MEMVHPKVQPKWGTSNKGFIAYREFTNNNKTGKKQNNKRAHCMGEIFANVISNKGLLSNIYRELIKLNKRKIKNGQWTYHVSPKIKHPPKIRPTYRFPSE